MTKQNADFVHFVFTSLIICSLCEEGEELEAMFDELTRTVAGSGAIGLEVLRNALRSTR